MKIASIGPQEGALLGGVTFWRRCDFIGENVLLGKDLRFQKLEAGWYCSLFLLSPDSDVDPLQHHVYLGASMFPAIMIMDYTSKL